MTLHHWVIVSKEHSALKTLRTGYPMMQHHIPEQGIPPIICTIFHITQVFEFFKLYFMYSTGKSFAGIVEEI
jgi:hypothetical protein